MMKATELRIGNLCQSDDGILMRVNGLEENVISFYVIDRSKYPIKKKWQAQPIPLTAEWLEKAEFEKVLDFGRDEDDPKNQYWKGKFIDLTINCELSTGEGYFDSIAVNGAKPLKYVHELQNFHFAFTGKELEFKP